MRLATTALLLLCCLLVAPAASSESRKHRAFQNPQNLAARVAELEQQVEALSAAMEKAQHLLRLVRVEEGTIHSLDGPHVVIEGANLHVRSGSGSTDDGCGFLEPVDPAPPCESITGLGNLIVGYNEAPRLPIRTGSHNVIVGPLHEYTRFGGLAVGFRNTVTGRYGSVSGGSGNLAKGPGSSVCGGSSNSAVGPNAAVLGGRFNRAHGDYSAIGGGQSNEAGGELTSIGGGLRNLASGFCASVTGGEENEAGGGVGSESSSVCFDAGGSISGGEGNLATGRNSSVSGGRDRSAPDDFDWAAGSLFEPE